MSTNSTSLTTLLKIVQQISLTVNFLTIIIGTIGGICNFITFTTPKLRRNSCVFYLLCANTFQMISILIPISIRLLLGYFGDNLESQSIIFCKARYYLSFTLPALATFYMLLSILDRCLTTSSHAKIRAWSQIKVAYPLSFVVFIFGCIINIHIIVFQVIYNNKCQISANSIYEVFLAVHIVFFISLLPHILMLILCLITFLNLKQRKTRILPNTTNVRSSLIKRFEAQLITIIVTQTIVGTVFLLLRVGSYSYSLLTRNKLNKIDGEIAAENLTLQMGVAFYFFNFALSFYISTLTSKYFRETFRKRVTEFYRRRISCRQF
ncbi:unnamed protein product [Rotaria sp. Silwood2]|nr:unnamed protein product [Rotaria sp. Silwood2]CAF4015304.1 unnamed protein product [Rotaria sp. Silwood2]